MDGGGAAKPGLKISFVVVCVCAVICLICYFYSNWSAAQAEEKQIPKLHIDEMVTAVRKYQKQTGQFPDNFLKLEDWKIWHHNPVPDFGPDKARLVHFNYYYIYHKVNANEGAIWAIPSGPKRETSPTIFLLVGIDSYDAWKGPCLSKSDIEKLPLVPTKDQLHVMGMTEQPQPKPGETGGLLFNIK